MKLLMKKDEIKLITPLKFSALFSEFIFNFFISLIFKVISLLKIFLN